MNTREVDEDKFTVDCKELVRCLQCEPPQALIVLAYELWTEHPRLADRLGVIAMSGLFEGETYTNEMIAKGAPWMRREHFEVAAQNICAATDYEWLGEVVSAMVRHAVRPGLLARVVNHIIRVYKLGKIDSEELEIIARKIVTSGVRYDLYKKVYFKLMRVIDPRS